MGSLFRKARRLTAPIVILIALVALGVAVTGPAAAQTQGSGGFGVGSGDGQETGIRLSVLNQVKTDIAAGVYDRACTEAEHDATKWHSLVNTQAKCHYDHHHGDDPNYVNDVFGEPGAWFQSAGQSISYPWQTFPAKDRFESNASYLGTGRMENEAKHEGYNWVVRRNQACPEGNCMTDFRLQYHVIFGAVDAVVRWHSFSFEGRMCTDPNNPSTCGIVRHGGWTDFGRLFVTQPGVIDCGHGVNEIFVPLPVDTQYMPLDRVDSRDEIRCHPTLTQLPSYPPSRPISEWWSLQRGRFRFQLRSFDPLGNINPNNPSEWDFYCEAGDPSCLYNQSITSVFIGYVYGIPEFVDHGSLGGIRVDPDRNGRTNFAGYANRMGGLVQGCTTASLDCIPLEFNDVSLNAFGNKEALYTHTPCDNCQRVDHDISPAGKQWIDWFFKKYGGYVPNEPVPQPEDPTGPAIYFQVDEQAENRVNVNVKLIDVAGVFGVQTECKVNPQVLQGAGLVEGDGFNQGNSFIIDDGFQTDGVWRVGTTRLKPNPAITGTAVAYTMSYNAAGEGEGQLECSALAVDENGVQITLEVVNGTVMILPEPGEPTEPEQPPIATEEPPVVVEIGTISGLVAYQNRPNNGGITVKLLGVANEVITEVTTSEDGAYTFPELPIGDYTLEMVAPQHIAVLKPVMIESANSTVQLNDQLRAGDVDDSGIVDMVDITLLGANFGLEVIPEIGNVDLNADGWVNVSDLSLAGGNLDLAAPTLP